MRVNPINVNYQQKYTIAKKSQFSQPTFEGKHESAKALGGLFGTLATLGAIGGSLVLSGGLSLPFILGYGAIGAASGAVIGHRIDKNSDKNIDELENNQEV